MPMDRYVNGIWLRGEVVPGKWVVRSWECNGVLERSAVPYVEWREMGDFGFKPDGWTMLDPSVLTDEQREELEAERRERALRKAAQRAKTTCRRVIITEGFNELLTLTYRENQPDRELCKRHFKEWVRRMKRAIPGFRYCAAFEVQDRGSMHVHLATHRLPSHPEYKGVKFKAWQLGTAVWRDVVGEGNGLCFVGGKKRGKWYRKWSLAKMAAYVSKYIMKDYQDAPAESNRYSRSNGTVVGEVHSMEVECSYADLVGLVYEYRDGDAVLALRPSRFKDRIWFCKESPPLIGSHVGQVAAMA